MLPWPYRPSRKVIITASAVVGAVVLLWLGLGVVYPRVGAWAIRSRALPKVAARLGCEVEVGAVQVRLGHATLRDVVVRSPHDGSQPLVRIDRIDVDFSVLPSLIGSVDPSRAVIDGVALAARRDPAGADNFRAVLDRLGVTGASAGGPRPARRGGLGFRPQQLEVKRVRVDFVDESAGVAVAVAEGDASVGAGPERATLRGISVTTLAGPSAGADTVAIAASDGVRTVTVGGGRLALWPGMSLTGITGSIGKPSDSERYQVSLSGGYGGVDEVLWTASGWVEPLASTASLSLRADGFHLDRLRPILQHSGLVNYEKTSVDARLQIDVDGALARFAGGFHLRDLAIGHPMIAEKEVEAIDVVGDVVGSYDRIGRVLTLEQGDFVSHNLPFRITGTLGLPGGALGDGSRRRARAVTARLVVPPVPCQQALDAIPVEMALYLQGFELRGTFDADVRVAIDWNDLDATDLGGSVGLFRCKVKDAPEEAGERFLEPFEHFVELEKGEWMSFLVGPDNPDFVPITEISPYLIKSILSTEDSAFYHHRGFLPGEFKSALIKNLKAGTFKYGASSITMQLVKNILLYREKTASRKLQELFLSWYIETVLEKDRLLEIYFNVIEYGPGLYGIGPAARHYFGKAPRDINPREAAFFSTILPSPKDRYKQYCEGTLRRWTQDKIDRILKLMLDRERLTPEEYQVAMTTPLVFIKDGTETVEDCIARVKRAIKNARPTNPMKK